MQTFIYIHIYVRGHARAWSSADSRMGRLSTQGRLLQLAQRSCPGIKMRKNETWMNQGCFQRKRVCGWLCGGSALSQPAVRQPGFTDWKRRAKGVKEHRNEGGSVRASSYARLRTRGVSRSLLLKSSPDAGLEMAEPFAGGSRARTAHGLDAQFAFRRRLDGFRPPALVDDASG